MPLQKWDGHTHTAFCPHGTDAELASYLDRAVELGFSRYSVTEHSPVPANWIDDEQLMKELAMEWEQVPDYLDYVERHKLLYADKLDVLVGMELDYLYGHTDYSDRMVDQFGARLEDIIVSLHYLPGKGGMRSLDYNPADFREGLLNYYGTMEAVVNEYYNHLEAAIEWASALPGQKRIGHINLIEKFRQALPEIDPQQLEKRQRALLPLLKKAGLGVDVNTAGLRVATCGKSYVESWFMEQCREMGITLVFGSDAHRPEHVGAGWDDAINEG